MTIADLIRELIFRSDKPTREFAELAGMGYVTMCCFLVEADGWDIELKQAQRLLDHFGVPMDFKLPAETAEQQQWRQLRFDDVADYVEVLHRPPS